MTLLMPWLEIMAILPTFSLLISATLPFANLKFNFVRHFKTGSEIGNQ